MRYLLLLCLFLVALACQRPLFREKWLKEKAPEHFSVVFETSRGNFEADFTRQWSPLAVDRLYAQIKHRFYDHTLFYRVRPNYVVQFGGDDSLKLQKWNTVKLLDEPVLQPNERGAISYARSGKDSRDNDLFINLQNNSPRLDTLVSQGVKGYPVLGKVTKGMEVVDSLYNGYGDRVFAHYGLLMNDKKAFLEKYPRLDSLQKIRLIKK
ncbi:MAG: peptidylprolyl isomerase [Chitinophagaceae bacterium]|nr:MAG: peptidylprolyl isomerase [Chitinophagaceae bacterium]